MLLLNKLNLSFGKNKLHSKEVILVESFFATEFLLKISVTLRSIFLSETFRLFKNKTKQLPFFKIIQEWHVIRSCAHPKEKI